ncbi:MAG: GNAT family N-acetyltransferase [Actinomycetota bacterium]|nr:GNAT family N-acetyltransferase [Actinomycetota bacterium]
MHAAGHPATGVEIQQWTGRQFSARVDDAMSIYVQAMGYPAHAGTQRAVTARRHTRNAGFACRAAIAPDGSLAGFGYGYTTVSGQWWHDLVRRAMTREMAGEWLANSFELSELHVLPRCQGAGIGRSMLTDLAGSLPHRAMLLSTPDADTRAFRMYHNMGFSDLARHYLFPGDARPFAVMGVRLPLVSSDPDGP